MATSKATFSAHDLGSRQAWCTSLETGFSVAAGSSTSRSRMTLVPKQVTSSSWDMTISFRSVDEWRSFANWLQRYLDIVKVGGARVMRVEVPAERFSRAGVLVSGGYSFGETFDQTKTDERLRFEGVSGQTMGSPAPILNTDQRKYYPTGLDLDGQGSAEQSLYDQVTDLINLPNPFADGDSEGERPFRGWY